MRHPNITHSATIKWLVLWVLIPNLPFIIFWFLGGPPRYAAIGLYYGVGILSTTLAYPLSVFAYLLAVSFDVALFTSNTFNLSVSSLLDSLVYVKSLDPLASYEYTIFGAMLLLSIILVASLYKKWQTEVQAISFIKITSTVLVVCALDSLIQFTSNYHIGQYLPREDGFSSAVTESGLLNHIEQESPDKVLFVMVEGWGAFRNAGLQQSILGSLNQKHWLESHDVTQGTAPFYGSTTAAEMRELCGNWGEYQDHLDSLDSNCLPARMKLAGYDTFAIHGFTKTMFQRDQWYPNVGFAESAFLEDLWSPSLTICKGVFTGICDPEIGDIVRNRLLDGDEKQFVYWLTLNSHLPIHPGSSQEHFACDKPEPTFDSQKICRIANIWGDVFKSVEAILASDKGENISVLLVGDHSPPYWGRHEKSYFLPDRIPWVFLKAKAQTSS